MKGEARRERSLDEYRRRLNLVFEFIDENLDEDLSVSRIATVANFSPYHFHRIFHALAGESLATYVRELRLARASRQLLYDHDKTITEIALESGFQSSSDFARAFKRSYRITPSAFAKRTQIGKPPSPDTRRTVLTDSEAAVPELRMEELPDFSIAYVRAKGLAKDLKNREILDAFRKVHDWASASGSLGGESRLFGVFLDDPQTRPMESCRYDACVTLQKKAKPLGEIGCRTLESAGTYAVFTYPRSSRSAGKIFFRSIEAIYASWFPSSGYFPADKPFLEFYGKDAKGRVFADFCIPVRPLFPPSQPRDSIESARIG
jgi:AraC family transcriptional regulator